MSRLIKLIFIVLIFIFQLFNHTDKVIASDTEEKTFMISAYCSPNESDPESYKKLNSSWNPSITASWNKVFKWVAAWPKSYPFGTKIYLDWFWVIEIQDRWCAIVEWWNNHYCKSYKNFKIPEYDRIDIWMWYGDECKKRAIQWWRKIVRWSVVSVNNEISISFSDNWLLKNDKTENIEKVSDKVKILMEYGDLTMTPESSEYEIKKVQELFKKLELYNGKIDWNYETIKYSLISFQKEVWIVDHEDDWWAWYLWDKTKTMLIKYFENNSNRRVNTYSLKQSEIEKLKKISKKVTIYLKQKAKWNKTREIVLKNTFINQINVLHGKTNNEKLKSRLLYLKENI